MTQRGQQRSSDEAADSPPTRKRWIIGAVIVAAVLVVAAVGVAALVQPRPQAPAAAEMVTPSPTVAATPTPTASPLPPQPPVTVAGGSCDDVIPSEGLPPAIGAGTLSDVTSTSLHTLGGLSCRWSATWYVEVDLFPASVVPGMLADRYSVEQCESIGYDGYGCRIARATDELWALVTVFPGANTYGDDVPRGLVEESADVVAAGLPDLATGQPAERAGWTGFADCDDMAGGIDLEAALGEVPVEGGTGTDASAPDPVEQIATEAGALIGTCVWSTATDVTTTRFPALWVTIYPGAADGWDRLVEAVVSTGVDTTVVGAEAAVIVDREDNVDAVGTGDPLTRLLVSDGESIIQLASRELDRDVRDVAAELLAAR